LNDNKLITVKWYSIISERTVDKILKAFFIVITAAIQVVAGDPVQFSVPTKTVNTPSKDPLESLLNKPIEAFKPGNSMKEDITMMQYSLQQPTVIIPKKENKNDEMDPFLNQNEKFGKDSNYEELNRIGNNQNSRRNLSSVEQYLIQQERQSMLNRRRQDNINPLNQRIDNNNFDYGRNRFNDTRSSEVDFYDRKQFDPFSSNVRRVDPLARNDPFARSFSDRNDFQSFMGLKGNEQADKLNRDRIDEFKRLLDGAPSMPMPPGSEKTAINNVYDLTRKNDNPITTMSYEQYYGIRQKEQRGPFENSPMSRPKTGLSEEARKAVFQNRQIPSEQNTSPEAERERQRPKPLFGPMPRRAF